MTTFEQRLRDTLSHAYEIDRELGGGGMSRVFVATDRSLGRKVVIKLLSPELTADVNRGRFRREIQVAAQLQHPHIVTLLSAGEHEDFLYYTMPFIAGESLKSALEKHGPLSVEDVVRVLYHVSEALDYAHGEGVVHRDIKPANILRSGTYSLITDFGVAKALNASMPTAQMTSTGMAIGTPAYMAPEQLAGDASADHRIDIYAVGLLAYELLKGRSPFAGTTPQRVLAAVLTQDPPPLIDVRQDVPRRLSEIVMRCLSKEPDVRPDSARALLSELDSFSTASGEIRTTEHMVPRVRSTKPAVPATPPQEQAPVEERPGTVLIPAAVPTPADAVAGVDAGNTIDPVDPLATVATEPPRKSGKKMLVGGLALLIPIAAGAIFLSQRNNGASAVAPIPDSVAAVAESTAVAATAVPDTTAANATATVPAVVAAPAQPNPDSVRRKAAADSARKARAEAAKLAAAKNDSVKKGRDTGRANARRAARAMLGNATALAAFNRGATRMGGPLNTRRRGDLQTQIDALQPFLISAGLTYDQFKSIVAESGVNIFDQYGRMLADSLQRFAAGVN